jgi:hypothetical protein
MHIRTGEHTTLSYFLKPLSDQVARLSRSVETQCTGDG